MTTEEVINFFGGKKELYAHLKLKGERQTVHQWGDRPPMTRQWQIECLTNGRLRADDYGVRPLYKPRQSE